MTFLSVFVKIVFIIVQFFVDPIEMWFLSRSLQLLSEKKGTRNGIGKACSVRMYFGFRGINFSKSNREMLISVNTFNIAAFGLD